LATTRSKVYELRETTVKTNLLPTIVHGCTRKKTVRDHERYWDLCAPKTFKQGTVLGNAGTLISFRVGAEDAPYLAREFWPRFNEIDLTQPENYHAYLKLIIDGIPTLPFSARTLPII
jgi:hypothetical protein